MTTVLVTGAGGFLGKNLSEALGRQDGVKLRTCGRSTLAEDVNQYLHEADVIYHLAGANRPETDDEFESVNVGISREICSTLTRLDRSPKIVFSSSIQAALNNPYGTSKRRAEQELVRYAEQREASVIIYRFVNVFGKWCRPNYNSVIATFCHNIANGIPIDVHDPDRTLDLIYVDDAVNCLLSHFGDQGNPGEAVFAEAAPVHSIDLKTLSEMIMTFRGIRSTLTIPDFSDRFIHNLYATYLSYLPSHDFSYPLDQKVDPRGVLAEFLKSPHLGQIFVSRTKPGITRGNHYHDTKTEKFLVLHGDAIIRFRHVVTDAVMSYEVAGHDFKVVDVPPGFTHSIENVGKDDMIVLFWASEAFDTKRPDTFFLHT